MKKSIRVVSKFLLFPKKYNKKWYWLKRVNIVEKLETYKIIEWPLIPWGFGGPWTYLKNVWKFAGIVDESNVIKIFVPDKDSPIPPGYAGRDEIGGSDF